MLHLTRIWHGLLPLDAHAQYGLHGCLLPLSVTAIRPKKSTPIT